MKIIVSLLASLVLFGCKPAERSTETPKARFEPQATEAMKPSEATAAKALVTPEERQKQYANLENTLMTLEQDINALRTRAATGTKEVAVTEEIAALSAKIATARNELLTAQQLDTPAWPNRRDTISAELESYRTELSAASKKVAP